MLPTKKIILPQAKVYPQKENYSSTSKIIRLQAKLFPLKENCIYFHKQNAARCETHVYPFCTVC